MEPLPSDLQAQIDKLNLAIREWWEQHGRVQGLEQQLSELSARGAEILNRWTETERRHAQAVGDVEARLRDWGTVEGRLQQGAEERVRAFELTIQREWQALRAMHEEPLKQLREQAATLAETSVAAANLSLRGYDRAEARLAVLEADVRSQLGQLSGDVQRALAEMRAPEAATPAIGPPAEPSQLDSVRRLHRELREADRPATDPAPRRGGDVETPRVESPEPARAVPEAAPAVARERSTPGVELVDAPAADSSAFPQVDLLSALKRLPIDRVALAIVVLAVVVVVWMFGLRRSGGVGADPVEAAPV